MNSAHSTRREEVLTAVNHLDGGRVPIDFGSTAVTGIHASCVATLHCTTCTLNGEPPCPPPV